MKLIKNMTDDELLSFIRGRLSFPEAIADQLRHEYADESMPDFNETQHRRFDMSGYGPKVTSFNTSILDLFEDIGIYDYTSFLVVDFYKGTGTIYMSYFGEYPRPNSDIDCTGFKTIEIIKEVINLTVLSGRKTRRRD